MSTLNFLDELSSGLGSYLPTLVGALAILLLGWIVALLVAGIVRGALRRTTLDERIASWLIGSKAEGIAVERWIAKLVFYFILLFALVAFFETLGLSLVASSLDSFLGQISSYLPRLLEAGFVLVIAWVSASASRLITRRVLSLARIDKHLEVQAGVRHEKAAPLAQTLSDAVYWLIFLLFLPALLEALALHGLLEPMQGMIDKVLTFLPNLFGAGLLLLVGWFVARIVQRILTNLLVASGADHLANRVGITHILGAQTLSGMLGVVAYVLVLIPVLIAALNTLGLDAVTDPASNMLGIILAAIPSVFAAGIVMVFAYIVGRLVSRLVANLLDSIGFDNVLKLLGMGKEMHGTRKPSEIVGYLTLVGILLFSFIEAMRLLGFEVVAGLVAEFIVFSGHVLLGLVIFAIGLYLANVASHAIATGKKGQTHMLALAAKIAILVFAGAMALRQMGLANEIISIAFGLILGSLAVAVALAFGLGGRDVAARHLEGWTKSLKKKR